MADAPRLWHVVVTVTGPEQSPEATAAALLRLQGERPFIHSMRYDGARAEVAYWEEGENMLDAASLALRLWNEHRTTAELPDWTVVGLEVVERETFQARELATPIAPTEVAPVPF